MSAPESRFVEDIKAPLNKNADVEQGPPSYPLHESEELVVGGPRPRCQGWRWFGHRRVCGRHTESARQDRPKRSKFVRAIKWLFAGWLLLSAVHLVVAGFRFRKAYKTLECATITPTTSETINFSLPLGCHSSRHFLVHDSLTGGDSLITHDPTVVNGTVQISVTFAKDAAQDEEYDGCMVRVRRGTAIGLISRKDDGSRADIKSLVLRFPMGTTHPSVKFIGKGDRHIPDSKLRKVIRWWRKHHQKKDSDYVESDD